MTIDSSDTHHASVTLYCEHGHPPTLVDQSADGEGECTECGREYTIDLDVETNDD